MTDTEILGHKDTKVISDYNLANLVRQIAVHCNVSNLNPVLHITLRHSIYILYVVTLDESNILDWLHFSMQNIE